jgi:hypothetical protein
VIKHVVMWRVSGNTPEAQLATREKVRQQFEGLRSLIPGLLTLEVGLDVSGVDYACDVVLYTEFDSPQALAAYADHPEHLRVRRELEGLRVARFQVDYIPAEASSHA